MSEPARKRVAVMISGRGSNLSALLSACDEPAFPAEIVCVLSNKADAGGLAVAREHGVEAFAVLPRDHDGKAAHEAAIEEKLRALDVEIICLAGYMRLLTHDFVERWRGRMINIHPSLLPLFTGLDTHARALAAGMRIHGCTVHFVTPEMDEGPAIAQAAVPVRADDDADTLAVRVLAAEHRLYPHGLRLLAEGAVRMENGRSVYSTGCGIDADAMLISPAD